MSLLRLVELTQPGERDIPLLSGCARKRRCMSEAVIARQLLSARGKWSRQTAWFELSSAIPPVYICISHPCAETAVTPVVQDFPAAYDGALERSRARLELPAARRLAGSGGPGLTILSEGAYRQHATRARPSVSPSGWRPARRCEAQGIGAHVFSHRLQPCFVQRLVRADGVHQPARL